MQELDLITDDDLFTRATLAWAWVVYRERAQGEQKLRGVPENTPDHRILSVVSDLGDKYLSRSASSLQRYQPPHEGAIAGHPRGGYITDKVTDVDLFDQSKW